MPIDKDDIVAESLAMFEMALSIGRMSGEPAEVRSRNFLRLLLARKNISFGSVWVRSDIVEGERGSSTADNGGQMRPAGGSVPCGMTET